MSTPIKNMSLSQYLDYVEETVDISEMKITEGKATVREALTALSEEMKHPTYSRRLVRYLDRNSKAIRAFESPFHKQQFETFITKKNCADYRFLAAIYLLTADERVWREVRETVTKNRIDYMDVDNTPEQEGYTLFQVAKDLTEDTCHITISQIADSEITKPSMFLVISKAIAISLYGVGAVGIKPIDPHEEEVVIFKLTR